jgi:hypothetical protein
MRTVERFSFIFGIVNLALGVMSLFSLFVDNKRGKGIISRYLPVNRNKGLFNRHSGQLLGGMGAVNPPQAYLHTILGALGLATRPASQLSRAYMALTGVVFAALAVMGWFSFGMKPGIHTVKGIALDWRENIIHTLFGASALLLALRPNLGQRSTIDDYLETGVME